MSRVLLPLLVLLAACVPAPQPPSVLLITLDTTRADHLGPYGYSQADTPAYDTLAREGTVFLRAYSTCPLTIPSHSTILTGRVPPSHGVRDNGDFVLGDEQVTLAERFHDAGYFTAAFTAAFPTRPRWGFYQGFDVYSDPLDDLPDRLNWSDRRTATEVVDDALEQLSGVHGPSFVWVHLFDAHWPYTPPEPYQSQHPGDPYSGEIAYASHEVGRFLDFWDERFPRSLVVVTADHGEGLGDGGEKTHGFLLHDGTIHVPLILRGEGIEPGKRVEDPVSHIDIAPTILHVAGLPTDDRLQGVDLRDGGSEVAYSESLTGQFNLGLSPLFAYTDADGRYMEGTWGAWYDSVGDAVMTRPDRSVDLAGPKQALADLRRGFEEVVPQEATLDAESQQQMVALGYLGGDPVAKPGTIDPRDVIDVIPLTWGIRQALGHRDMRKAQHMLARLDQRMPGTYGVDSLRAQLVLAQGRQEEAYERFTGLYLRSPNSTTALKLGDLCLRMHRPEEAEGWYVEALERNTVSPEAMAGRVRAILAQGGRDAEAEALADQYLVTYPDHAQLVLLRAQIELHDDFPQGAWEDAETAVEAMPRNGDALAVSAEALWALGRPDDAIERMRDALAIDRFDFDERARLTGWLLEVGRDAEAYHTIAPVTRLQPWNEDAAALLAQAREALDAARAR